MVVHDGGGRWRWAMVVGDGVARWWAMEVRGSEQEETAMPQKIRIAG
jgi:peroxiredoxin